MQEKDRSGKLALPDEQEAESRRDPGRSDCFCNIEQIGEAREIINSVIKGKNAKSDEIGRQKRESPPQDERVDGLELELEPQQECQEIGAEDDSDIQQDHAEAFKAETILVRHR